jgi:hypothetical protein
MSQREKPSKMAEPRPASPAGTGEEVEESDPVSPLGPEFEAPINAAVQSSDSDEA